MIKTQKKKKKKKKKKKVLSLSVRTHLKYVLMYVRLFQRRPLSKSNSFNQNFIKLGHIVMYHDVFIKLDNGLYRTMPSGVLALCL